MLYVKFCGITQLSDALAAVDAGADALGFVYHEPSSRNISVDQSAWIVSQLPPHIAKVGVFVDPTPKDVLAAVERAGLTCAQIHGEYAGQISAQLADIPTILAIQVRDSETLPELKQVPSNVSAVLLDTFHPNLAGGTGEVFNWSLLDNVPQNLKVVLAGGLTPSNIRDAVNQVKPYAVDVSSGIERSPGIKSDAKMKAFMQNLKEFRNGAATNRHLYPLA